MKWCNRCCSYSEYLVNEGKGYFVDDTNRKWDGEVCPTCKYGVKVRTKTYRKGRKCKKCGLKLVDTRRYYHEFCNPGELTVWA